MSLEQYTVHHDFEIEDCGIEEQWVYDIEVENNHNFFGNDILVHNSIYVDLEGIVNIANKNRQYTDEELVSFVDLICNKIGEAVIIPAYDKLQKYMNNNVNLMNMDREAIAIEGGFFVAKKRYALSVNDNEGVRYDPPKLKLIGIETQRSSTPKAVTGALINSITALIQKGESSLQSVVSSFDDNFNKLSISQICGTSTANNIFIYGDENIKPLKGCPGHVKGALAYNRFIHDNNLKVQPINDGEKINIVTLKMPNPFGDKVFGWPAGAEIDVAFGDVEKYIDYNTIYNERFLKPITSMCSNIENMNPVACNNLDSFFG